MGRFLADVRSIYTREHPAFARSESMVRRALTRSAVSSSTPPRLDGLSRHVSLSDLGIRGQLERRPWFVPLGLSGLDRVPAGLVAYEGEHALVAGPPASGKSTTLLTAAAACRSASADVTVIAVAGSRSPLSSDRLIDEVVQPRAVDEWLDPMVQETRGPLLVLVDDAETIDDDTGALARLSAASQRDLLVVAAGRSDGLRAGYSHWTRPIRRSKMGVLLHPDRDLDGLLLGADLHRLPPADGAAGRGYLVNSGEAQLIQVALPG